MKKTIITTMLVALMLFATAEAKPVKKSAVPKKDATEQVEKQKEDASQQETEATDEENAEDIDKEKVSISEKGIIIKKGNKNVEIKFGELGRLINEHLDDTVLSSVGATVADSEDEPTEEPITEIQDPTYNVAQDGMRLARDISSNFFWALVAIVFLALLFYYMHRRRKYKTVDRAIMNNYPLPDEFFGKRSQRMPQQPTNVYINQVLPPQQSADPNAPQGTQQPMPGYAMGSNNPLNNITDWTPFKSGFTLTAVGLGLLFFFLIVGAEAVAALMLIIVFIGLGRLFTTYQEQQSMKNYWQQQQWTQQANPNSEQWTKQPQQPQQPQQQADTNPVPPMQETPPEFNQRQEK